jgi:CubicO group peptidase (beta-lactamase class C family)
MHPKFKLILFLIITGVCAACSHSHQQTSATIAPPARNPASVATSVAASPQAIMEKEIIMGSAAKRLGSSVRVSGRSLEHVMAEELNNPALAGLDFKIIGDGVTVSSAGLSVQALHRPYVGCTLLKKRSAEALRAEFDPMKFPVPSSPRNAVWPIGNHVELPTELPGVDLAAIHTAVDQSFDERQPDQKINTRAVVIVHKGKIIAEKYKAPFHADMPQLGWSMTKTVTGILTGMLVEDGKLDIGAPAPVPEWQGQGDLRASITLNNLLQMSSGLEFSEVYKAGSMSDVILMLFKRGDTGAFSANKSLAHPPGTHWEYASGTTNILSRIHKQLFADLQDYIHYPHQRLFRKLNMDSAVMEMDESGVYVGSSYMYATPRDWAKIGMLLMQQGKWNGEQILSESWVKYCLTPADTAPKGNYGAQIWLNAGEPGHPENRPHPGLPSSMYYLSGFEGQNVLVLPDHDLVVVLMGFNTTGQRPVWALAQAVMLAVE